jgi:periplasmic divalent cation tolerance protein
MLEANDSLRLVVTTAADAAEAMRLGRTLVEERLAACTTILPGAQSVYRWKGHVETCGEAWLLIKTTAQELPALEARLHALHGYDTPEFLVLAAQASAGYLAWILGNVGRIGESEPTGEPGS